MPPKITISAQQRQQIEALYGLGLTTREIEHVIGISHSTIENKCKEEIARGIAKADAAILNNLKRIAMGDGPSAASAAIFWVKCRRKWHEIQRVIHGFDPGAIQEFVCQFLSIMRRELPVKCPHCQTNLNLAPKIAGELKALSAKMIEKLPPDEIVPKPPEE